ncbi:MAG: hypothetical protein QTN59_12780 [Candidatus Electrothrix communis]|nr:hypothetical protein [Desulfobulbus sp. US4]WLE95552.1 MAG: hypothetical protein QTN59_12780 [Candidatus Electrothrix communis]
MPETLSAVDQLLKKRLIFTVTTGRSGTAYLTSIFGYARKVYSVHEPAPEFVKVLREVQDNPQLANDFWLTDKFPAILQAPADIYVETSHLVCKGFLESLLEFKIIPDLILHRRPARDVACSMFTMGTIPGRSDKGCSFYLSPDDPGVLHLPQWEKLHDYQLCYWYCLEIERRACVYGALFKAAGSRIAETTLASLKTFSGLKACFSDLELDMRRPVWLTRFLFFRATRVKVNQSLETKKKVTLPENISELEKEVISLMDAKALRDILPAITCKIG